MVVKEVDVAGKKCVNGNVFVGSMFTKNFLIDCFACNSSFNNWSIVHAEHAVFQ